jgi:hypothetical protein
MLRTVCHCERWLVSLSNQTREKFRSASGEILNECSEAILRRLSKLTFIGISAVTLCRIASKILGRSSLVFFRNDKQTCTALRNMIDNTNYGQKKDVFIRGKPETLN